MNNIRDINTRNSGKHITKEKYRHKNEMAAMPAKLTEEELEELIAAVESEPMLHPPRGFHDDIINQIRRKRKHKKNLQLFSYSMKVIAATAAAVGIVLIVPENIGTEESRISGYVSEWQAGRMPGDSAQGDKEQEDIVPDDRVQGNKSQGDNEQEDKASEGREKKWYAQEIKKAYGDSFIYKLNKQMDEYLSIVNGKLNQFVRMEVNFNEEEKE